MAATESPDSKERGTKRKLVEKRQSVPVTPDNINRQTIMFQTEAKAQS